MMFDIKAVLSSVGVAQADFEQVPDKVNDLIIDSREVQQGDVFVAIKGHALDGGIFVEQAIIQGAVLVIADSRCVLPELDFSVPVIILHELNTKLAHISAEFYGRASEDLTLVGVTGTNGKSTITSMIANLASQCGQSASVIGTLGWGKTDNLTPLANTTPSNVQLQKMLRSLADDKNDLVAMEVSSHGLIQSRVNECQFSAAVFSNLSRDHLDYHGDMKAYADAKLKLFTQCDPALSVINIDDKVGKLWVEEHDFNRLIVFGKGREAFNNSQYVLFDEIKYSANGISANFHTSWGNAVVKCALFGEFNLYNLAASLAVLLGLGFDFNKLIEAVKELEPVAGRMQSFSVPDKPTCVVDYAHTPDALSLALQALQQHVPGGVTCVFGCGGDRDKGKRAIMARAAEKYSDKIIVTSDNPRTENADEIIKDILMGFNDSGRILVEPDRAKAIALGIQQTNENEVVLIAGKGHEDYQIIGTQVHHFCDRKLVKKLLAGEAI